MNIYELLLAKAINGESGSGSNMGYEYETGIYTPSVDESHPTITFAKEHDDAPVIYAVMGDVSETGYGENDVVSVVFFDNYHALNEYYPDTSGTTTVYASNYPVYGNDTNYSSYSFTLITKLDGSSYSSNLGYYVSNTAIKPYAGGSGRKFRSTISYKWIAIWNHPAGEPTIHKYTISGTVQHPFGDALHQVGMAEELEYALLHINETSCTAYITIDASILGFTEPLTQSFTFGLIEGQFQSTATDNVISVADFISWRIDADSDETNTLDVMTLRMLSDNTVIDMKEYASAFTTSLQIVSFMPLETFAEYEVV